MKTRSTAPGRGAPGAAGFVPALAVAAALVAAVSLRAPADRSAWPERPITMIVPYAAGGPTDIVARILAHHMSRTLGERVVIENVTGGGGTIGTARAARAPPDGYTIEMGHMGTHGAAPAIQRRPRYDPVTDFAPVGLATRTPIVIVARKDLPPKDLAEFVAYAKAAHPRHLKEAHAGEGSVSFTTCSLLNAVVGAKPRRLEYRGTGPALNDLVSGHVDYMCDQIVSLVPHIRAGRIKAYAVALPERSPALPNVPTTKEAGLPGFQVTAWNALFAPKGTPADVVAKLNGALVKALRDPETRERLLDLGAELPDEAAVSPDGLRRHVEAEVARWREVLNPAGP